MYRFDSRRTESVSPDLTLNRKRIYRQQISGKWAKRNIPFAVMYDKQHNAQQYRSSSAKCCEGVDYWNGQFSRQCRPALSPSSGTTTYRSVGLLARGAARIERNGLWLDSKERNEDNDGALKAARVAAASGRVCLRGWPIQTVGDDKRAVKNVATAVLWRSPSLDDHVVIATGDRVHPSHTFPCPNAPLLSVKEEVQSVSAKATQLQTTQVMRAFVVLINCHRRFAYLNFEHNRGIHLMK